jgi:DNA polymerase lambda
MGICKLNDKHPARRIDIKAYPLDQYGFALLYFTGSGNFNRSMRLFAQKKGYSLSDYGLNPVIAKDKKDRIATGTSVPCPTEEDVFKALNLPYKTPKEREI